MTKTGGDAGNTPGPGPARDAAGPVAEAPSGDTPHGSAPSAACQEPAPLTGIAKTIALVGMMGSGKTAVGRALAARLDLPFRDSDSEIEDAAQASIAEIFARDGEVFFRAREAEVISRLLDGPPCILSTGGGAWVQEGTRALLVDRACPLWLDVPLPLLWERVQRKQTRPLLKTADPFGTLSALDAERRPVYALAPLSAQADPSYSIDQMAAEVERVLSTKPELWSTP